MTETRPRIIQSALKESCFGTYVFSPLKFKCYMLTHQASDIAKNLDGKKTISEVVSAIRSAHKITDNDAIDQVNNVIQELQKLGVLSNE